MGDGNVNLPPGFRFEPTDEELVLHFLHRKASRLPCHPDVIPDLDLIPYNPWELQGNAMSEGGIWYYYSRRTPSRVTNAGVWKLMGTEESIYSSTNGRKIGLKSSYVFHLGQISQDASTEWIMQEFRLPESACSSRSSSSSSSRRAQYKLDQRRWVVCKVFQQTSDDSDDNGGLELSCLDEVYLSMDDLDEISLPFNYN
ncbi:hypothetical protein Droror1_Dr00006711 [Drosera rotundifolia]